jgi:DNA-binding LytR/AlgR family response regulator
LVLLVNKQGKRYPVDYNLDQLEQILNPDLFFRINRKIILNIESVKKISNYFNGRLILQIDYLEGDNAIVSRDRVGDFKGWLS